MAWEFPEWLNAEFMEKVLRKSENDVSIRVADVSVKAATNTGDNYCSVIHRATVNFTRDHNGMQIAEQKSIIAKVVPERGAQKLMVTSFRMFETEISMMSDTLVRMNRILGSGTPLNADALFTRTEEPMTLILEDLAPLGFQTVDRQFGLDLAHCLLAVRRMAEFHGSSVALKEKDPEAVMKYTKGKYNKDHVPFLGTFYRIETKALGEQVAKWPELGPRYSEKIMKYSRVAFERGCKAVMYKEGEFAVLNHGDYSLSNMLFKYDSQGNPIDHIFVDFQFPLYSSPVIDLLFFLITSPSDEVRVNDQELLVKEYHNSLASTMLKLNCATTVLSYEELKKAMNDRATITMVGSFVSLPTLIVDKSKAKDYDKLILGEEGVSEYPEFEGRRYRDIMLRMIPLYDEMGLLDI